MKHDTLTGLGSHRAFMQELAEAIEAADRHGTHLNVLMLDLDNFREYNNTYDHAEGDVLLRRTARMSQPRT